MKKKALIVVNLAGFLHFLWNDIATLQEMGYEVSVAMNENSAAGPNLIEIPKLEEMGIAHYQVEFDTKSPVSTQNIQAYKQLKLILKTNKYDLIHCHTPLVGILTRIHENGMDYVLVGDYYVPDLKLPEERRPIGHWGRLHQSYLKLHRPMLYNELILSGSLHTVVADLNEQAADRLDLIIRQMMKAEGVTEAMKAENQMLWVQSMNSIRCRAEEIIKTELIYC